MVATPRFASTVILYRLKENFEANQCNFEVLLIQRSKEMKFLGGVHAFPGGKLEDEDYSEDSIARCRGINKLQAHRIIQDTKTYHQNQNISLGFWIAGIREVFEEIGILFAYNKDLSLIDLSEPEIQKRFKVYRKKLLKNQIHFYEIMEREDLYYAVDKLFYFRHFITPEVSSIRYDTRFFIAKLPPTQNIMSFSNEIIALEWASPSETLTRYRRKEIILIPPQYSCFLTLRRIKDIEAFCDTSLNCQTS